MYTSKEGSNAVADMSAELQENILKFKI